MQQPLLVGVCGGTGSGKTTVAQAISAALGHECVILPQDAYYKDNRDLPLEERVKLNLISKIKMAVSARD
ncbi:MAG: zeta toxin family protein [Firmicutes bacterium]|nr:zeta toxin family protein [Bacillota bacterium]